MTTHQDAVDLALAAVDEDGFTRAEDGTMLAQTSSQAIIATMIRELDVTPGDAVLEIGTGSGYSTALLAHLTGPDGSVVSLDVVPELTERAAKILSDTGYRQARTVTGDGALGEPPHAPYNKIIAWTTPEVVPSTWIAQAADGARLVTPVNIGGLSKTYAVITAQIEAGRLNLADRVICGAFVEMSARIRTDWLLPPHGVSTLHTTGENKPLWLSAAWLDDPAFETAGRDLARQLATDSTVLDSPLRDDDDPVGFYAWLLATRPEGLTTACLSDPQWRIGHTGPDSAALLPLAGRTPLIAAGQHRSIHALSTWIERWRGQGAPGWQELRPYAELTAAGNWAIRVTQRPPE